MNWYKQAQERKIAYHRTSQDLKEKILRSGKFIPSSSGWKGPGLYAYLTKPEDAPAVVCFDYSHLKLWDGKKPLEISQNRWDNARKSFDSRKIDKIVSSLGYDAEIDLSNVWIRVFPASTAKVFPMECGN